MAQNEVQNVLAQFGLPPETEEQYVSRIRRQAQETRQEELDDRVDAIGKTGASSRFQGNMLFGHRRKMRKQIEADVAAQRESPEARMARLGDNIRKRHEEQQASGELSAMTDDQVKNNFNKIVAEQASALNMPGVASSAAKKYVDAIRSQKKAELEQEKLGYSTRSAAAAAETAEGVLRERPEKVAREKEKDNLFIQSQKEKLIGPPGLYPEVYTHDGRGPFSGVMDEEGDMKVGNQTIPNGEWTTARPRFDPTTGNFMGFDMPSIADQEKYRKGARETLDTIRKSNQLLDIVRKSYRLNEAGEGTNLAVGAAGGFRKFVTDIRNTVQSLAIGASSGFSVKWNGPPGSDPLKMSKGEKSNMIEDSLVDSYGQEGFEKILEDMGVDEDMMGTSNSRAQFDSLVTQLAYSFARAQEPGSKSLSDGDFKNAITAIGAGVTNPRHMQEIFVQNVGNAFYNTSSKHRAVPPENLRRMITEEFLNDLDTSFTEFQEKWAFDYDPSTGKVLRRPDVELKKNTVVNNTGPEAVDATSANQSATQTRLDAIRRRLAESRK